jgi:iron complex outermembrane receptor protein
LNGINISNPQTGHNASDFPVSLSDIERIEILEGAASRLFGSSAFSGTINIVTKKGQDGSNAIMSLEGGSWRTFVTDGQVSIHHAKDFRSLISCGYSRSDGGTENSDFMKSRLFYQGGWNGKDVQLNWQVAANKQKYGANTFYSPKFNNQYEKTEHAIMSLSANINLYQHAKISSSLYYNQFKDHYQLIRNEEGAANGENYHNMKTYGVSANFLYHTSWGNTSIGSDIRKEHLLSTAYGELLEKSKWKEIGGSNRKYNRKGGRTNYSVFAEQNILLKDWTISVGLLFNHITAPNAQLSATSSVCPGVDVSFHPSNHWKLTASWNTAMRVPTYTDLYISNVAQQGDIHLKPEKNSMLKAESKWKYRYLNITTSIFYSHGTNMIDWVYENADSEKYHALNIGKIDNVGTSISADIDLSFLAPHSTSALPQLKVGYAYIHQGHESQYQIYKSLYALEYLRHKITMQLTQKLWKELSASCQLRWQQRTNGFHPYTKIDCKIAWDKPKYSLFAKIDNLTNHRYYEIGSVLQPGIWIMVGGQVKIKWK